jgi:hypothetical protein
VYPWHLINGVPHSTLGPELVQVEVDRVVVAEADQTNLRITVTKIIKNNGPENLLALH